MKNRMKMRNPAGGNQAPIQQMNFSKEALQSAKTMTCQGILKFPDKEEVPCAGEIFVEAFSLRYISPIMSPVGRETVAAVQIGKLCVKCGKIFNPDEWKKNQKDTEENKIITNPNG